MSLLPEKVKPIFLLVVLVLITVSYFKSDTYLYGKSVPISIPINNVIKPLCRERREEAISCKESVEHALVPVYLNCISPTHDLIVCSWRRMSVLREVTNEKPSCAHEAGALVDCQRDHFVRELRRRGFSSEELVRLPRDLGGNGTETSGNPSVRKFGGGGRNAEPAGGKEVGGGGPKEAFPAVQVIVEQVPSGNSKNGSGNIP